MKRSIYFILLILSIVLLIRTYGKDRPDYVSIIELVVNGAKYDGKEVFVRGFLTVKFESTGLYLTRECAENGLTKNGLWVRFSSTLENQTNILKFNKKYVSLKGTFNAKNRGHMELWSGTIDEISKIFYHR